jgi:hypothetical protein
MGKLKTVELIRGVPIRLAVVTKSDPARFKAAFADTWRKLPPYARSALRDYWNLSGGAIVFLTVNWTGCQRNLAQCSGAGGHLHFLSSVVDRLSDDLLRICIAHELAHAFFFATGDPYHCGSPLPEEVREELAEALVHAISAVWGFAWREFSHWCVKNADWLEANAAASRK